MNQVKFFFAMFALCIIVGTACSFAEAYFAKRAAMLVALVSGAILGSFAIYVLTWLTLSQNKLGQP